MPLSIFTFFLYGNMLLMSQCILGEALMFKKLLLLFIVIVMMYGCNKKETENSVQKSNSEVKKEVVDNTVVNNEKKVQNDIVSSENSVLTFKVIEGKTEIEIYSKDKKSNEEKLLTKVTDFYFDHYHSKEFVNNSLFIVRRTGDIVKWTKWSDELWKYDLSNPNGKKLFDVQGLDFRVSSDGKYVAVSTNEKFSIIDSEGKILFSKTLDDFIKSGKNYSGLFQLEGWSFNSNSFWLTLHDGEIPNSFFKISKGNWELKGYSAEKMELGDEFSINTEKDLVAMSDFPHIADEDSYKDFQKSKAAVKLYIYDLNTGKKELIDSSVAKDFSPKWTDEKTLEYKNPSAEGMKTYQLK